MRTVAHPAVVLLSSLLSAAAISAQTVTHAPDGGTVETLQSIAVPATVGAPFRATVVTTWTRVLEDGTHATVKNYRTIARDSTGRVFQERRYLTASGDTQLTPLRALEYLDPNRQEFISCNPVARVCVVSAYAAVRTVAVAGAAPAADPPGLKRESLGEKWIEDVETIGSREIRVIAPGENGFKQSEPVIKEFWYSPRLDLNLVVKRFLPRGGAEDFAVTNLNLSEPDPAMFTPPEGYRIVHVSHD